MADKKISELVSLAGKDVAATDIFPVVDVSVAETKSLTRDELRNAVNAIQFAATKALATTAAASLPDDTIIEVAADESLSGTRTRYTVAAGALVFGETLVNLPLLGELNQAKYIGSGPVLPFSTDIGGNVIFGFNTTTQRLTGAKLDDSMVPVRAAQLLPLSTPPIVASKNHMLSYGDSTSVGGNAGAVLSTTQPYSNLTFNGGPRAWDGTTWAYSSYKPLVEDAVTPSPDGFSGNRKETCCSAMANYATTLYAQAGGNPANHVIVASTAGHGGYTILDLKKGTAWYTNMLAQVTAAKAIDSDYSVQVVAFLEGANSVAAPISYATYLAELLQLQIDMETDIKAISGQAGPVYMVLTQVAWHSGVYKDIAIAQLYAAQTSEKILLATPQYHLPYTADFIHLTAAGNKWQGAYIGSFYYTLVHEKKRPKWLNPVSATHREAVVRVRFDVPVAPLVLDTTTLAETTDNGFKVLDGASAATISSITVDGSDVVIALSATPSGAVTVRYGLDYLGTGLTVASGASGNLRDSAPESITISGVVCPLYNVCPHFEMLAVTLGE